MNYTTEQLVDLAREQGWRIERKTNGAMCFPADGTSTPVTVHFTSTVNGNTHRNMIAQFRRSGLRLPDRDTTKDDADNGEPMNQPLPQLHVRKVVRTECSIDLTGNQVVDLLAKAGRIPHPNSPKLAMAPDGETFLDADLSGVVLRLTWIEEEEAAF